MEWNSPTTTTWKIFSIGKLKINNSEPFSKYSWKSTEPSTCPGCYSVHVARSSSWPLANSCYQYPFQRGYYGKICHSAWALNILLYEFWILQLKHLSDCVFTCIIFKLIMFIDWGCWPRIEKRNTPLPHIYIQAITIGSLYMPHFYWISIIKAYIVVYVHCMYLWCPHLYKFTCMYWQRFFFQTCDAIWLTSAPKLAVLKAFVRGATTLCMSPLAASGSACGTCLLADGRVKLARNLAA